MTRNSLLDIDVHWQFVSSGTNCPLPKTTQCPIKLKKLIDDEEHTADDVNTRISFDTLYTILDNIVSDPSNDFVDRSEYEYTLRPAQFVTKTVIYANTETKGLNLKKSRGKFNNSLKSVLSDEDLRAAIELATCEYEPLKKRDTRSTNQAAIKVQGKLVSRTLNIVVFVTKQRKKKRQAIQSIQIEKTQKKQKKNFRFKINSLLVQIFSPIITEKKSSNITKI